MIFINLIVINCGWVILGYQNKIMQALRDDSEGSRTHNFIGYKTVPKHYYTAKYKNVSMGKPEEKNYLYRHLKNQKIINTIFGRIFKQSPKSNASTRLETSHLFKTRAKTEMGDYQTYQSRSSVQKKQVAKKICSFNRSLLLFHRSMSVDSKRITILNKFNRTVKNFQEKLPTDMGQQTRQSIQENEKLIQLCIQDSLAKHTKKQFNQRYEEMKQYSEPMINEDLKKTFVKKKQQNRIKIRNQLKNRNTRNKTEGGEGS